VKRFVAPLDPHKGVGVAFNGRFFAPQPPDRPAAWAPAPSPGRGITMILPAGPRMLDLDAPAIPVRATPEGVRMLGTNLASRFGRVSAKVQRPPAPGQASTVLVDSDAGPLICAHALGRGFLWRFAGQLAERDAGLARDAAAGILHAAAAPDRTRIALVSVRNGPENGAFAALPVAQWRDTLARAAKDTKREFIELPTAGAMLDAIRSDNDLMIVNPYGEWLPVAAGDTLTNVVAQIARHVRAGGRWFETGGYPFHAALRPSSFLNCESTYPPVFADFVHLEAAAGRAAVYRVQPRTWAPWAGSKDPAAVLIPGRLGFGGDVNGGRLDRSFARFIPPGVTWTSPVVRIAVGGTAEAGLAAYATANGIARPLRAKMKPEVLDHLPPNSGFGTAAEMRELHDTARKAGHLVMPYTNPTWWCDHPRGPTFLAAGEAPLAVGLDGKPFHERYASNDGWTTCFWHPAVRAANRELRRQFLEDQPVDILFQDQVGARAWRWDLNSASPSPHAYAEGLLSQADEDAALAPLGTEDGWDRVVDAESMLCVFFHHDLGKFVTGPAELAWTLGLGFNMSYRMSAQSVADTRTMGWLAWVDRIQKSVCARATGEPVGVFEHRQSAEANAGQPKGTPPVARPSSLPEDDGVMHAEYGPVRITANLGPAPRTEDGRELAGFGFRATAPGMVAGHLHALAGVAAVPEGFMFVTEGDARRAEVWILARPGEEVAAELPPEFAPVGGGSRRSSPSGRSWSS